LPQPKKVTRAERGRSKSIPIRLLVAVVLLVLLVPTGLLVALHIPAVQDFLLQKAIRKLETSAELQIELASSRWQPFHELRLFDLKVKASGQDILECGEASLAYQLSWKWPYVHPLAVVLDRPSLHLDRDAEGQWRLPVRAGAPEKSSQSRDPFPWSRFPWPQVRIVSGTIAATQNGQVVLSIGDVNATISVQEAAGSDAPGLKIDFGQWQGEVQVPPWGRWQLSGAAEIRNEMLLVSGLELAVPGVAHLHSQGRWQLAPPHDGNLELQIKECSLQTVPFLPPTLSKLKEMAGTVSFARHAGRWSLDHDLQTNLGGLKGTLQLDPGAPEGLLVQLTTRFRDLQVAFAHQPPTAHLSGQVDLTVKGKELETAQASLHALIENSRWGDQTIERGELTASYELGVLELKPASIQSSVGHFDFSAVADVRGLWDLNHAGSVKVELDADQASLDRVFGVSSRRVGGRIVYRGRYEAGNFLRWEQWQGEMEAGMMLPHLLTLKAAGTQQHGLLNLDYEAEIDDLQTVTGIFPALRGKGEVKSRGNIRGSYPDLLWDGMLTSSELQIGPVRGEKVAVVGKGRLIGREGQRELSLKAENLAIEGRRLGAVHLEVKQEADICRFNLKGEGLGGHGGLRLAGRLERLWGPVRTLLITQSSVNWGKQSASLDGRVDAGREGVRVHSLAIQHEHGKVQLAGEVLFAAKTDLKLTFDGINLGKWLQVLAPEIPISGVVSGQLAVKGRADQPEASLNLQMVNGIIMIPPEAGAAAGAPKTSGSQRRDQLIDRLQLQGALAGDLLSIQGSLQSPAVQTPLHFTAKVPLQLSIYPPRLSLKSGEAVASAAKVSALQAEKILPYLDFLDRLGGRVDLDVQVGGTLAQPTVLGVGSWQNGSFRVAKWPNPIENIEVDFRADAREIVINQSSMNLLGGDVRVKGQIGYPRFYEMDFEAEGNDLEVRDIYGTKGKVSGHARLLQTPSVTRLTGILNLSNGEMNLGDLETDVARNISVVDGTAKSETIEVSKDTMKPNSFGHRLEMDLTINLPPAGTWVRGKGLEAEITGALKIEKRPFAGVKLRGGFQTLRGEYRLQDYKLKIVDGEVIFPEGPEPDPQLKIVCQKEVRDAIIQVQVTGPLKQPKLIMSSIPAMNQVDILSYLVFDRPAGDLSSQESLQLQDKAASWMGTQTSILLKQVLGDRLFTPDTIEYRKSSSSSRLTSSSQSRTDSTVVAIGKHITPDLYVNFEKGVTGEEGDQITVEYRVNRHLSVQTEFAGTDQSGIDVFWRYDFGK